MKNGNGKPQAIPQAAAPAPAPGQAPTLDQLIAEAHARGRRITADQVYVSGLIDTLVQEIVHRDNAVKELRERVAELEAKVTEAKNTDVPEPVPAGD